MKLYPKELRNIKDLERERSRLLKASRQLEKEEFLSLGGSAGKKKKGRGDEKEEGGLLDLLSGGNPWVNMLLKFVQSRFSKNNARPEPEYEKPGKRGKNKIWAIAFEFIGGYLKWKAIELTFKGIRSLIRKSKDKSEK